MLEFLQIEYQEKRFEFGKPDHKADSLWAKEKATLELDFPNIPYYLDGDVRLSHNLAILRYLARKHQLDGKDEKTKIRIDLAEQQLVDMRNAYSRFVYDANFDKVRSDYVVAVQERIELFSKFLGALQWFAGEEITYVDFLIYEMLNQHRQLDGVKVNDYSNLQSFLARFESLPRIKAYLVSDRFLAAPFNGDWANFGGMDS